MAWEVTHLLSPILLLFLASGSWAQDTELLQTVAGQTIFVKCQYNSSQRSKEKIWCQKTTTESCKLLDSSLSTDTWWPKFSIWDRPDSYFFTIIMTALTIEDSGLYFCGIPDNHGAIAVLRRFHLVVSRDSSGPSTSDIITTVRPTKVPILMTTKYLCRDTTVTRSTAVVSSADPGATFTNVTNVPRVSMSSIVVPMVCGLLSKTLIFTVLFAVTWRSFGGQTMKPHNSGL